MEINEKKIVNLITWYLVYDMIRHPIKNRKYWGLMGLMIFSAWLLIAVILPVGVGILNISRGESEDNFQVVSFSPWVDHLVVKNGTDSVLNDIQFQIPLYQCRGVSESYLTSEQIEQNDCLPLRTFYGSQETLLLEADRSRRANVQPGQTVELTASGNNFRDFMIMEIRAFSVEPGYRVVESTPVFYGTVH